MSLEKALEEQQQAITVLTGAVRALTAVIETFSGVTFTTGDKTVIDLTQAGPTTEPEKKKQTAKKITAAAIIDDKPEEKVEEPDPLIEEALIVDDLAGDEPLDYEAIRSECRTLINQLIEAKKRDAVVAIFDALVVKSLKEVKDNVLTHVKTKLEAALK